MESIRYKGRDYRVLEQHRFGSTKYLAIRRLGGSVARRLQAIERRPGVTQRLVTLHRLPRNHASRQQIRALERAQRNPNLPAIEATHPLPDEWLVVTRWVGGQDLAAHLAAARRRPEHWPDPVQSFWLIRGLAHGLSQLYRYHSVVHGDVKPANVILTSDRPRRLVLIDFGSAWLVESAAARAPGDGVTRKYAAPELLRGDGHVDWRCDQFSLGVVFYELLTGQLPYDGLGGDAGLLADKPASPSGSRPVSKQLRSPDAAADRVFRAGVDALLNRTLRLTAANRYPTPAALLDAFGRVDARLRIGDGPPAGARRFAAWIGRLWRSRGH